MKTMPVGEIKTLFSAELEAVKKGERIAVSYGKRKENIAVIVPYAHDRRRNGITLGLLKGKATFALARDFNMTVEEFLEP